MRWDDVARYINDCDGRIMGRVIYNVDTEDFIAFYRGKRIGCYLSLQHAQSAIEQYEKARMRVRHRTI